MVLPYPGMDFVPLDVLTASEMNQMVANDKYISDYLNDNVYPVGSVYISVVDKSPAELFGGTWERFAQGKTLIGVDESDADFAQAKNTGGEKTHKLTVDEMPSHSHQVNSGWTQKSGQDKLMFNQMDGGYRWYGNWGGNFIQEAGGDQPHNNLPPYITVYMWVRTA